MLLPLSLPICIFCLSVCLSVCVCVSLSPSYLSVSLYSPSLSLDILVLFLSSIVSFFFSSPPISLLSPSHSFSVFFASYSAPLPPSLSFINHGPLTHPMIYPSDPNTTLPVYKLKCAYKPICIHIFINSQKKQHQANHNNNNSNNNNNNRKSRTDGIYTNVQRVLAHPSRVFMYLTKLSHCRVSYTLIGSEVPRIKSSRSRTNPRSMI